MNKTFKFYRTFAQNFFCAFQGVRGQAVIEYVLLMALISGILLSLFFGPVKLSLENSQNLLRERTSQVLSQSPNAELGPPGIPIAWFGFKDSSGTNAFSSSLGAGLNSNSPQGSADSDAIGPLSSPSGAGGEPGQNRTRNPNSPDSNSNPEELQNSPPNNSVNSPSQQQQQNRLKRQDSDQGGEESSSQNTNQRQTRGGLGDSSETDAELNQDSAEQQESESSNSLQEVEEDSGGSTILSRRQQELSRVEEQERRGCQSLNIFMILKILGIILLIFFIFSLLLQRKRGNEDP